MAENAFVAHMWRDPSNPKTVLRYPIPTKDVMRNKARAATAWFGEFIEKVMSFPEYEQFTKFHESLGDMSEFAELKKRLGCAPFSSYLTRFSYVYLDAGLIPPEVFQLREVKSGRCLERIMKDSQPHGLAMTPCTGGADGQKIAELQLWHPANRDIQKPGKGCCSGLANWNFLQCMDAAQLGGTISTFECIIMGFVPNQRFAFHEESGQLQWRQKAYGRAEGCVVPSSHKLGDAKLEPLQHSQVLIDPVKGSALLPSAKSTWDKMPQRFRLRSESPDGGCASTGGSQRGGPGAELSFQPCSEDEAQVFSARAVHDGFEIRVGHGGMCLDSASGTQVLVYPCYDQSAIPNVNQLWQSSKNRLVWPGKVSTKAVSVALIGREQVSPPQGEYTLRLCADKRGQRLKKEPEAADGTFEIRDLDENTCLSGLSGDVLGLTPCGSTHQRWRIVKGEQLQHVGSGNCLDSATNDRPILYPCHRPTVQRPQKFHILEELNWIQNPPAWGDNGRKRWFEKCLDRLPVPQMDLALRTCDSAAKEGVRWEKLNAFLPLERKLWDQAEKPPAETPPLGGDTAVP